MRKLLFYIIILFAAITGCKRDNYLLFSGVARVQLNDTSSVATTFYYDAPAIITDTIYIRINTIGGIAPHDRPVKLGQVTEYDYTLVRDPVTNLVIDTIETEKPFKAQPGVHYVSLDDKATESLRVVKANQATADIPVILLRDASLKENNYRLRVRLLANEEFSIGEQKALEKTIIFSDKLERFYSWRVDTYSAPAFSSLGKYSTAKHQFMIDVLKTNIDEDWYQSVVRIDALRNYINILKQELIRFNTDPANLASGKAPLRETSDPSSALVTFP